MAGGYTTPWVHVGTNTQNAVTSGTDSSGASGTMASTEIVPGAVGEVRKECDLWLVDGGDTHTNKFDWTVNDNFTVVLNATKITADTDFDNVVLVIQGSVDGANYVDLQTFSAWNAGTSTVGHYIYDYGTYGLMPCMRVQLNSDGSGSANDDEPMKIVIVPHGAG